MPSKKKNPDPKNPLSLDDQAKELHDLIEENEDKAAPLYLKLGSVIESIQVERNLDWKGLLAYATDTLGLRRSRIVRARRIWNLHHENPTAVINGLTVYEALAHEPKEPPKPEPVGSPLTAREFQAAARYEKAVGGKERAVEVLTRIINNGEKPPKGSGGKRPRLSHIIKVFATKERDKARKDVRGYVTSWAEPVLKADETYTQKTNDAIAAATTDEMKAKLLRVLKELQEERDVTYGNARDLLSKRQVGDFDSDTLAFVVGVQRQVNEALGLTDAAKQSVADPAVPSASSAN